MYAHPSEADNLVSFGVYWHFEFIPTWVCEVQSHSDTVASSLHIEV